MSAILDAILNSLTYSWPIKVDDYRKNLTHEA